MLEMEPVRPDAAALFVRYRDPKNPITPFLGGTVKTLLPKRATKMEATNPKKKHEM